MPGYPGLRRTTDHGRKAGGDILAETKSDIPETGSNADGTVLVAVDFSADSEAALVWACQYANLIGAHILVLHVVHDPGEAPGYYRRRDEDAMRPMEDVAKEMLEEFLISIREKHGGVAAARKLSIKLVRGIPATRILEAAEQVKASLIVMGSRGRTGLPHLLLGSKAERVAQMAPMPVTIVKAERDDG